MSGILDLVRDDLREFAGYSSARRSTASGSVWLNANESPWVSPAERRPEFSGLGLNRYPDPQPAALRHAMAALYGVDAERVLVTRGSDEAIDLLVRALCRAGGDGVVVSTPTFGMYAVCARVQGTPCIDVPLVESDGAWRLDIDGLVAAVKSRAARLVFLCSPNNPTGQAVALDDIVSLATHLSGSALLVVDEAYGEFCREPSAATRVATIDNLAVLRTLSKAHALAGARIGALLADPALIRVLRNVAAPYPLPTPSVCAALAALERPAVAEARRRAEEVVDERERVATALRSLGGVRTVYASQGNFLLVRFDDAEASLRGLLAAGIVVRDMRASERLGDALRLSIGTRAENDSLLAALGEGRAAA